MTLCDSQSYHSYPDEYSQNYFADDIVYSNPDGFTDGTLRYLKPRQELMNDAYSVQSTAYAILAHVAANKKERDEREMAVGWMNLMRNSVAGFASTQVS